MGLAAVARAEVFRIIIIINISSTYYYHRRTHNGCTDDIIDIARFRIGMKLTPRLLPGAATRLAAKRF